MERLYTAKAIDKIRSSIETFCIQRYCIDIVAGSLALPKMFSTVSHA